MSEVEERLDGLLAGLEGSIAGAEAMTGAFRAEMEEVQASMRSAGRDASSLSRSLDGNLKTAFSNLIMDGARASDVMSRLGQSVANMVLNSALKPVTQSLSGALTGGLSSLLGVPFEKGGAFTAGRVTPFAKGGVVDGPVNFPMRGGLGLMGEAGPEAIMPLARGPDGSLGVRTADNGRAVNVTMNITTPDVAGFSRSRSQIAAQISRAMGRGRRNL